MREYILQIARDLYRDRPNVDLDEVAAIANVKLTQVLDYFPSAAVLGEAAMQRVRDRMAS